MRRGELSPRNLRFLPISQSEHLQTQPPLANEPALPHSHLLEKIRSMGEKAQIKEQNRAAEASAPMPVKRKLII